MIVLLLARSLAATVSTLVSAATITIAASNNTYPASADPLDPYIPNLSQQHCPGGHGGFGGSYGVFYCDGKRYPDGSYWHEVIGTDAAEGSLECAVDNRSGTPSPAPPGGCAGTRLGDRGF